MWRSLKCLCLIVVASLGMSNPSRADIIAAGFFSGTLEKFDEATNAESVFATISSGGDPFPGLSGIAYDKASNRIYVAARISNRVYSVDATSGAVLGNVQLAGGSSPAGIAVSNNGTIYVANNGGNSISRFNSSFVSQGDITLPNFGVGNNLPSGLAFDSQGNLLISTFAGVGVVKYDVNGNTFSSFNASPAANGQVAVDGSGNVFVGESVFSNVVEKFSSTGTSLATINIDSTILPQPGLPYTSPDFTSPAGVAFDSKGNLIVAALGRTNPTSANDNFQSNGGLFLFAPDGSFLKAFGTQTTPFSSIIHIEPVPEPASLTLAGIGVAAWVVRRRWKCKANS